jgi:hypothetical protein
MEKNFELSGDIKPDTGSAVRDTGQNYSNELSNNDGVDLNAGVDNIIGVDVNIPLSKSSITSILAGASAALAGAYGIAGTLPLDTDGDDILPHPTEICTEYNLPNTQIIQAIEQFEQTGKVPILPFDLKGDEDDGKFDLNKPRAAEELSNASRGSGYANNCDPPKDIDSEDDLNSEKNKK